MKHLLNVGILVLSVLLFSCSSKKEDSQEQANEKEEQKDWSQMDEFHMIMAETFHPYKDSANLQPVKAQAAQLVAAADKWAGQPLPEKVNTDEVKTKLQQLKSETEVLEDKVQSGGSDQEIGEQLNKVHDLFHEIQEAWYGGGHGHEHGHDDHGHEH